MTLFVPLDGWTAIMLYIGSIFMCWCLAELSYRLFPKFGVDDIRVFQMLSLVPMFNTIASVVLLIMFLGNIVQYFIYVLRKVCSNKP